MDRAGRRSVVLTASSSTGCTATCRTRRREALNREFTEQARALLIAIAADPEEWQIRVATYLEPATIQRCAAFLREHDPHLTKERALHCAAGLCRDEYKNLEARARSVVTVIGQRREGRPLSADRAALLERILAGDGDAADAWQAVGHAFRPHPEWLRVRRTPFGPIASPPQHQTTPPLASVSTAASTATLIPRLMRELIPEIADRAARRAAWLAPARADIGAIGMPTYGDYRQAALIGMRRAAPSWNPDKGAPSTFLGVVAKRAGIDVYRAAIRHPLGLTGLPLKAREGRPRPRVRAVELEAVEEAQVATWGGVDDAIDQRRALARLKPEPRALLELLMLGFSINEAARELGTSRTTTQRMAKAVRIAWGARGIRIPASAAG